MRVAVEGLIGCGKSTLLRRLAQRGHVREVVQEPLEQWSHMLPRFYSDPKRWGFPLQVQVLLATSSPEVPTHGCFERSPHSALNVFGRMVVKDETEAGILHDMFDRVGWKPDCVVFLRSSPQNCLKRIGERSRDGEHGVTLEYLQQLDSVYKQYLLASEVPVYEFDESVYIPSPDSVCERIEHLLS